MGLTTSRSSLLSRRRDAFLQEQSRVLRWSAEVLARTDENIDLENSFLLDYDAESIAAKVDVWIRREINHEHDCLDIDVVKLSNELKQKMSKAYESAYADLRRFGRKVDKLAERQRRIHKKLLDLDPSDDSKKLMRLRLKVSKNLRASEKMFFRDRRLRHQFIRKVYDIDYECSQLCRARLLDASEN